MALHRSITFSSGLLVLLCLIVGWIDSGWQMRGVSIGIRRGHLLMGSLSEGQASMSMLGGLRFTPAPLNFNRMENSVMHASHGGLDPESYRPVFLPPRAIGGHFDSIREWRIQIAIWLILVLHLVLWSGLLYWRHRRQQGKPFGSQPI